MKNILISTEILVIFLIIFFLTPDLKSQSNFSAGAYVGGGYISGNSPDVGSLNTSVFIETRSFVLDDVNARLSFIYSRDINYYLGSRNDYYPFIKGISLKGITEQSLAYSLFLEEGIGLLYINDRTFSDTNSDDFGTVFSLASGFDFRRLSRKGSKLGLGIEYGITFNNTLANYLSVFVQVQFYF